MFKVFYYKTLCLFFYYVGDFFCKINYDWAGTIYQKAMNLSLDYDEKLNFWFWKEPPLDNSNEF